MQAAKSDDGVVFDEPMIVGGSDEATIDVFPFLYSDHVSTHWFVLWQTAMVGTTEGMSIEASVDESGASEPIVRPEILGYTGRVLATATPGIYWGVWVEGPAARQKIRHSFFSKP